MENRIFEQVLMDLEDYALILLNAHGEIASWNKGAERINGYTENEVKNKNFEIFCTSEDRAAGLPGKLLKEADTKGRAQREGWCMGKDEDKFWANVTIAPVKDTDGSTTGYVMITHDLSERVAAEKTIRDYESDLREMALKSQRLRDIYQVFISEVEDYAITMLDENGIIVDWNPGSEKIKGYSYDEIIGKHLSVFYPVEDRATLLPESLLLKAGKEGRAEHQGWRIKKDGNSFWAHVIIIAVYDKKGVVRNFVKITKDLTPWIMKERELKERIEALEF
ncbi:MAG TPA: PAS domain-containing protein, partial [Flavipsychrobacter sp.]